MNPQYTIYLKDRQNTVNIQNTSKIDSTHYTKYLKDRQTTFENSLIKFTELRIKNKIFHSLSLNKSKGAKS